jgi:Holliday junction resolvasome RuvABC DNA-binding subunit
MAIKKITLMCLYRILHTETMARRQRKQKARYFITLSTTEVYIILYSFARLGRRLIFSQVMWR